TLALELFKSSPGDRLGPFSPRRRRRNGGACRRVVDLSANASTTVGHRPARSGPFSRVKPMMALSKQAATKTNRVRSSCPRRREEETRLNLKKTSVCGECLSPLFAHG